MLTGELACWLALAPDPRHRGARGAAARLLGRGAGRGAVAARCGIDRGRGRRAGWRQVRRATGAGHGPGGGARPAQGHGCVPRASLHVALQPPRHARGSVVSVVASNVTAELRRVEGARGAGWAGDQGRRGRRRRSSNELVDAGAARRARHHGDGRACVCAWSASSAGVAGSPGCTPLDEYHPQYDAQYLAAEAYFRQLGQAAYDEGFVVDVLGAGRRLRRWSVPRGTPVAACSRACLPSLRATKPGSRPSRCRCTGLCPVRVSLLQALAQLSGGMLTLVEDFGPDLRSNLNRALMRTVVRMPAA
eukprot:scaffold3218_cov350-Prasinococcus_capsulatus_cf.AAC.11